MDWGHSDRILTVRPRAACFARLVWLWLALLVWAASFAPRSALCGEPIAVDDKVTVKFSGYSLDRYTNTYVLGATVANISTTPITGPALVFTSVGPSSVAVYRPSGTTADGLPYISIPVADGVLDPGEVVNYVAIRFINPNRVTPKFTKSVRGNLPAANHPPVAEAGPDQTAFVGQSVALDGVGSTDVYGDALNYRWAFIALPKSSHAVLAGADGRQPTFSVDAPGTYRIELIVNEGKDDSPADTVTISTRNSKPVAKAGEPKSAPVGSTVTLDGSASTDVDGDPLSFDWALADKPTRSSATLTWADTATPSLILDQPGHYLVRLIVNDGQADSEAATVAIDTANSVPVADAGPNLAGQVGEALSLDGRGSHDADGDALSFAWSLLRRPVTSQAQLLDPDSALCRLIPDVAGDYVAQLIVRDGSASSDPDTALVTVTVPPNRNPAVTSVPITSGRVDAFYSYDLDATDADGDTLTYSLVTGPESLHVDAVTGVVNWIPDSPGQFEVTFRVLDGHGGEATQTFSIEVLPAAPSITGISPASAEPGAVVTLSGKHLTSTGAATRVGFAGAPYDATVLAAAPEALLVLVPGDARSGEVSVTTAGGTATLPGFTVIRSQDFGVSVEPDTIEVLQNARVTLGVSLSSQGQSDYTGLATLAVTGLPAGVTASFDPPSLSALQSGSLVLTAALDTVPGTYHPEVRATGAISGTTATYAQGFELRIAQTSGQTGVQGRFVTPEGGGIPGVIVKDHASGMETHTDAAGNFRLLGLTPGTITLKMDATPANPLYPMWPFLIELPAGQVTTLADWVINPPAAPEHFKPLKQNAAENQIFSDERFPGFEITVPAGAAIIGWDGVPKSKLAVERIPIDRLPVEPPPIPAREAYKLYFGTPMGGIPTVPIPVRVPNVTGLGPGEKTEIWYFDGSPMGGAGEWKLAGPATISEDGRTVSTDAGYGIPRFC